MISCSSSRMFTYYSRILDKYNKPITAFAIFTDDNKSFKPTEYRREFMGTSLRYRFNAFKIMDQDEEHLRTSDNPFAIVILTVKLALKRGRVTDNELLNLKIDLAKNLLKRDFPKHKIRKLMVFLHFYVRFETNETTFKFDNALDQLLSRSKTMGIEEFIRERLKKEGRYEKSIEIIRKLLADKSYSIEEIARIVGEPIDTIRKISLGNK